MGYLFILTVGLGAGILSGIIGTGSSMMLVPVLAYEFGPKEAVPIMAVAAIMANISRVLVWWSEVDWRACAAYSLAGVPGAALGAKTLLDLPPHLVDYCIGFFLILMIPATHWLAAKKLKLSLWHLTVVGGFIGYLTGIVVSTGPINIPFFMAYGLVKGAFISTEAASSLVVYASKAATFHFLGALSANVAAKGLIAGSSLMLGAYIAKPLVLRLDPGAFRLMLDGLMLVSGLSMLWNATMG